MIVRLSAAICVAVAVFAYSFSSTFNIKGGGAARGATVSRSLLARAAAEHEKKDSNAALKAGSLADPAKAGAAMTGAATTGTAMAGAMNIAAEIARALGAGATITGAASTYNPFRAVDSTAGGAETASGEPYDPTAWTGAIQIDLREMFGGVRFGKDYRPCYALVVKGNKQAVIKINDVGTLEPGRVIDLNEQTMRYFDPSLELGLIGPVAVTPLVGDGWLTGPIAAND